jgi:hypothetical protein
VKFSEVFPIKENEFPLLKATEDELLAVLVKST